MGVDLKFLAELTNAPGVSGDESAVRRILRRRIEPLADSVHVDALGNLIAVKRPSGPRGRRLPRVMLAAHMDEVGLMVTHVDKSGYLRFSRVGGIDGRLLLAKRVRVGKSGLPGVIGAWPVHFLRRRSDRDRVPSPDDLAIDIGASCPEEALAIVGVGEYACFDTAFERWGDTVKAKALDDRVGCAILAELLKYRYPFELTAVFTVQEEVGLRGATVAAFDRYPDLALVLEGTGAADFPQPKDSGQGKVPALGRGPVITLMDRSVFCDRGLVGLLHTAARSRGIPVQVKRPGIGGTDAGRINLARGGVRTAVLAVACRYIHGPAGLCSLRDVSRTLELARAALGRLGRYGLSAIKI